MQSKLVKNFKNFLFQEALFEGGEKLVVGISGGADSVCLVELLLEVQEKFNLELQLVHINYHLRGEKSGKDELFVREFAEDNGLELQVVDYSKSKVKSQESKVYKKNRDVSMTSNNLEERLRDFRYNVFERVRNENKADWVVTGHHQDDQVETFLMNLFRGSGVDGLKGMMVKNKETNVLRPLLNFNKKEVEEFLESIEQGWREDESNNDNTFLRNRIRNELIPEIEKNYSLRFKERVGGVTRQLQGHSYVVRKLVRSVTSKVIIVSASLGVEEDYFETRDIANKSVVVDVEKYKELDDDIKSLVFREIVKTLKGDLRNISEGNYLEFEKIMKSEKGKNQIMRIDNLKFEKVGDILKINAQKI